MSFCKNCVKGVIHEGNPAGKIEIISRKDGKDGVECYVATPTVDYPKDKVILLLTDVFGLALVNNKLLADAFAENGFKTIVPDILHGDPVPIHAFDPPVNPANPDGPVNPAFDLKKWFANTPGKQNGHGQDVTRPIIDEVIGALQEQGVKSFAAVGYCFGGRYVFDLAFDNVISVAAVAHPSSLQVPADLEKYAASSKAPLLINSCPIDEMFPLEAQAKADEILTGFAPGYQREHFEGCEHGFAVRGDLSDPKVKAGKEGAFKATVEWFLKYL
ncbi:dienelactone hydrolase endo-1,3,1,4-beta-D-glucanase [Mycena vitilis]|nr:dienelactone hydrolase endo-1,3,1,4-beta-D-glucanase [Mycena vitilis]